MGGYLACLELKHILQLQIWSASERFSPLTCACAGFAQQYSLDWKAVLGALAFRCVWTGPALWLFPPPAFGTQWKVNPPEPTQPASPVFDTKHGSVGACGGLFISLVTFLCQKCISTWPEKGMERRLCQERRQLVPENTWRTFHCVIMKDVKPEPFTTYHCF